MCKSIFSHGAEFESKAYDTVCSSPANNHWGIMPVSLYILAVLAGNIRFLTPFTWLMTLWMSCLTDDELQFIFRQSCLFLVARGSLRGQCPLAIDRWRNTVHACWSGIETQKLLRTKQTQTFPLFILSCSEKTVMHFSICDTCRYFTLTAHQLEWNIAIFIV